MPLEIERKFLIRRPTEEWLQSRPEVHIRRMTQTYLAAPEGTERRVRRVTEGETTRFFVTEKSEGAGLIRTETERELTAAEYESLLSERLPAAELQKVRYAFPYAGHTVEIDCYPFWQQQAILEVELASPEEEISLPPEVFVLREVTDDPTLKNRALALAASLDKSPDSVVK